MTEDVARRVQRALELAGLPGKAAPAGPGGEWHIEIDGEDVTLQSLDALIEWLGGAGSEPGWHSGQPVRGFVFPDHGRG